MAAKTDKPKRMNKFNKKNFNKNKNPKNSKQKRNPLGPNPNKPKSKNKDESKKQKTKKTKKSNVPQLTNKAENVIKVEITYKILPPAEQKEYFVAQLEAATGEKLSSLELDLFKDKNFIKLSDGSSQDASNLGTHVKEVFGSSWKEKLCNNQLEEGKVDPGSPAVLIVSASALRSLELLRGLRTLGKECQVMKLFSKHIKVEDQVALLRNRVNVGSGTPSRIKKLCEMEALGLSRLEVIVLDMQTDVKGYSLFSLHQVRDEFWDLYKSYFHERLLQGTLRICLYGTIPVVTRRSIKPSDDQ